MKLTLGEYIKKQRKDKKISVRILSNVTNIKASRINTIESGARPTIEELELMGNICGYTVKKLAVLFEEVDALIKINKKIGEYLK